MNERPSILLVSGGMGAGGKERQIIELLKGLKHNNNYRTILAIGNSNGARQLEATLLSDRVIVLERMNLINAAKPFFKLAQQAKKEKVRLIHTWGSGLWDMTGWALARYLRIPIIHGGIRYVPSHINLSTRISRWAAIRSDVIVANSQAGLQAFGLTYLPRAQVIYNGVDLNRFEGINNFSENDHNICMVANFSNKKDHVTPVMSLQEIVKLFPDAHLSLIGQNMGTLGCTRGLVSKLNLSNSVEFIIDTLKPEPYIADSNICILTTHGEGISNAILEYMALSKPVIATDNGGNVEVVVSGITGILIPPYSSESLTQHIVQLFKSPDLANSMGEAGHKRLVEKFSFHQMVTSYETLYEELLENK